MKMILVDDEKAIVEGLKFMINRYIPECEVVGVAYNGADGVRLIQKLKPDLVITDIRMPQVDGLDMIKTLKDKGSRTKFILLSGYAEFEYARKALQLGVQSYINKPVEEDELQSSVSQAMAAIHSEKAKLREVDDLKQHFHSRVQENALREILELGSDHAELMEEALERATIPTDRAWFASMLLEFGGNADTLKEASLQQVFARIDQVLCQFREVYRFRYTGTGVAVVVAQGSPIGYDDLLRSVQRLKQAAYQQLELCMTAGVGTVQKGAAGISRSFEEARYALSYKVVNGMHSVISYAEVMDMPGRGRSVPEAMIAKLEAALDNMDEKECAGIIDDIFHVMQAEPRMNPTDLQLQCLNILLSSVRKMSFQQLQQNDFLGRHILSLEGMAKFQTLTGLKDWMIQVINRILQFKQEHNIPRKKDIIAEVKEYVAAHYNQPITLADLSARFFISPYYLSQFFKQKTGETYVNYLTQIRIGKAKELLEKTDLKVYEICERVGYTDTQHFAKLFEKQTGQKPRDYRKSLPRK